MSVYVIVLNWNNWPDTIECLESLLRVPNQELRVVICDNGSEDGSAQRLQQWCNERASSTVREPAVPLPSQGSQLQSSPFRTIEQAEATAAKESPARWRLTLIRNDRNLGFAGGNNVGIRYALRDPACEYIWILNNDTVVDPGALDCLLGYARGDTRIGICGVRLLYYDAPDVVQAHGGATFNWLTGAARAIGNKTADSEPVDPIAIERKMDYVIGASMLVSRRFIERVGLMEEGYFLYFEEIDWALRGRGEFRLGYSHDAVVYHKEGATIGSSTVGKRRSAISEYYLTRSRLKFIRRFRPIALPSAWAYSAAVALRRLAQGEVRKAVTIMRALVGLSFA